MGALGPQPETDCFGVGGVLAIQRKADEMCRADIHYERRILQCDKFVYMSSIAGNFAGETDCLLEFDSSRHISIFNAIQDRRGSRFGQSRVRQSKERNN